MNENSCNDMKDDLVINGFNNLEKIVIKQQSLQNLNSLKICNCEKLKTIVCKYDTYSNSAFYNVRNVIIESMLEFLL